MYFKTSSPFEQAFCLGPLFFEFSNCVFAFFEGFYLDFVLKNVLKFYVNNSMKNLAFVETFFMEQCSPELEFLARFFLGAGLDTPLSRSTMICVCQLILCPNLISHRRH